MQAVEDKRHLGLMASVLILRLESIKSEPIKPKKLIDDLNQWWKGHEKKEVPVVRRPIRATYTHRQAYACYGIKGIRHKKGEEAL